MEGAQGGALFVQFNPKRLGKIPKGFLLRSIAATRSPILYYNWNRTRATTPWATIRAQGVQKIGGQKPREFRVSAVAMAMAKQSYITGPAPKTLRCFGNACARSKAMEEEPRGI